MLKQGQARYLKEIILIRNTVYTSIISSRYRIYSTYDECQNIAWDHWLPSAPITLKISSN